VVGIGASAGGVDALKRLVAALPAKFRGALFVVMHIRPETHSQLPAILTRAGQVPAVHAVDQMPIEHGRIHVAPPDFHLLVERGVVRVVQGPRENRHRPAIDPLFRSLAWTYGPRAVGVVLTGNLNDGTAGLWAVKSCGGTTIVQEPNEADHPEMPMNALMHNRIDHRLPLEGIAALLTQLALEAADPLSGGNRRPR
jgi:two-component system chemotaxis response regulator CheB